MAPASRGTGEKGLCPSVVAMQGGCDSSPCCGRVALSRRCPGLGMTVGPNRGGPFDQLATANLTTAGGQPSESLIFEPRPRGAVVLAFRQGCVCLVAGGGQSANGTADWRTGALARSLPDASAIESNSERVDFAPEISGRDYRRMQNSRAVGSAGRALQGKARECLGHFRRSRRQRGAACSQAQDRHQARRTFKLRSHRKVKSVADVRALAVGRGMV
jgi:hypothetical protein